MPMEEMEEEEVVSMCSFVVHRITVPIAAGGGNFEQIIALELTAFVTRPSLQRRGAGALLLECVQALASEVLRTQDQEEKDTA